MNLEKIKIFFKPNKLKIIITLLLSAIFYFAAFFIFVGGPSPVLLIGSFLMYFLALPFYPLLMSFGEIGLIIISVFWAYLFACSLCLIIKKGKVWKYLAILVIIILSIPIPRIFL